MSKAHRAKIMGVINITPDSFSDGGECLTSGLALKKCLSLLQDGADFIDIGAESTRPGATPVPQKDEWNKISQTLNEFRGEVDFKHISIDTRHSETMLRCLDEGVHFINDVSGRLDFKVLERVAKYGGRYACMHMHGKPSTMQINPLNGKSALDAVEMFFKKALEETARAGIEANMVYLDPGIGFGKSDSANLQLIRRTKDYSRDYQVMLGVSRKSLIGRSLGIEDPKKRDDASKMLELGAVMLGAKIIRTHQVSPLYRLLETLESSL